ncbi:MAG: septum formation protein Maf [Subdoligranulum sp.]|nr:septum formation protein Maf [Subdoligranulum sp.]
MNKMNILLASASPRRQELLAHITPDFAVCAADVDEAAVVRAAPCGSPALLAQRLAEAKCRAVARTHPEAAVIGCDTVVDVDGVIFGKPQDPDDAQRMLRALSGRVHLVHTGVFLCAGSRRTGFAETTRVHFAPLSDTEIDAYTATDDPYDKAGAYGIQSGASKFITGIEGCYFNVMGLPVARLYAALRECGVL